MNLANKITVTRILMIPVFVMLFPIYPDGLVSKSALLQHIDLYGVYYAAAVFTLASVTDKLDGYIARKYNQITNLGKLLDPLADKLLISAALILMAGRHDIAAWVAITIIGREFIITGIRMTASAQKIALQADKSGKLKMVFQVAAISAVLLNNWPFSFITAIRIDQMLMYCALVLTVYSGYLYIKNNYRILKLDQH
ncbi:CDP-diacylglycerol--glycerol-3-phosphate 3-phosphatidyltransferase [Paenibacillus sp. FSL H7-0357]|uniref:CDP-diacylglycerol--glycerol-3-phosphate 3-phosphatidyltransferase n=1 Tax=Paenibacillus sp. FSL H7-0357 TaxID=1536774 RepID=UPI0004F8F47C|nr:CDP-diacylglycerol--glycerol-3-phosphate 3-phosphatidyltransferase [Paenibacillus sp. FSL H7-0357]AIQ17668.1 CDP-diacylglycerol--glycerol-3-phosphate 3-phosphatidyltransferase [Paenibacillus sp. FSL H7-0357]